MRPTALPSLVAALCASVLLAACASQPPIERLPVRRTLAPDALAYAGRVGASMQDLTPQDEPAGRTPPAADAPIVHVALSLYEAPLDAVAALLGSAAPHGVCVAKDDLRRGEAVLLAHGADCTSAPVVELRVRQRGTITLHDERAFVRSFDLVPNADGWIADPEVGTYQNGLLFDVCPTLAGDRVALDLRMLGVVPLATQDVRVEVPVSGAPVTLQHPVVLEHALRAHAELAPDEVLVIPGLLTAHAGQVGILCVEAQRTTTPVAAQAAGAIEIVP